MAGTATLRQAVGSLLVVGLSGTELTGLERAWLQLIRPGGIILFKRNVVSVEQTGTLLDEATGLSSRHALRCVDVEGGTVNRLREALAPIASTQAVAAAARNAKKPAIARKHGELIARAVKAFGFNSPLAPALDLALPEAAEVLGSRTAGSSPAEVVAYAREFLAGLAAQGVIPCGKHFPGLGGATGDTHFVTPEIQRSWKQFWEEDLVPYHDLHKSMPMIMVSHAAYPQASGKKEPASASRFWITEVLRKKIGYKGLVLTDDLEMGGILKFLPVEEAAVAAIRAGSSMMLICHSAELILRSFEALLTEAERSASFRKILLAAAQDSTRKRARLSKGGVARLPSGKAVESLRDSILDFNAKVASLAEPAAEAPRATSPAEAL